jgi:hypothetical protein
MRRSGYFSWGKLLSLLAGILFFLGPQPLLGETIPAPPRNLRVKGTPIPQDGKPVITEVSGTIAHGNEVVIKGQNFGMHADYGGPGSPYLSVAFQNFDNENVAGGNVAQHEVSRWGSPLRWVCRATPTGARRPGGHVAYSLAYVESGSALSNGVLSVTSNTNPTIHNTGVSYLSYWIKMDASNINNVARGTKLWRFAHYPQYDFWFAESAGPGGACALAKDPGVGAQWTLWGPEVFAAGQWHHIEFFARAHPADDDMQFWVDGKLIFRKRSAVEGLNPGSEKYVQDSAIFDSYVINMLKDGVEGSNFTASNIYIDHTWTHVLIGDAPTLSECTMFELQALKTWSANEIRFDVEQGGLNFSRPVYLFVRNADGSLSDGKALN